MTSHRKDPAIISTTKTWWERGTRPNSRLLAHPSALVRRSPANRPANPKKETTIVMAGPPSWHADEQGDRTPRRSPPE